jgi:RHS repeat-associated protein
VIEELNQLNEMQVSYIEGAGIDSHIARVTDEGVFAYVTDPLGTVRNVMDGSGVAVNSYDYKAYGDVRNKTEVTPNPYLYTGRRWNDDTKEYYYRARYYQPGIGRFSAVDRLAPGEASYGYVGGNPVMFGDPLGLKRNLEDNSVLIINLLTTFDQAASSSTVDRFQAPFDGSTIMTWKINSLDFSRESITPSTIENQISVSDPSLLIIIGHGSDPSKTSTGKTNLNWDSISTFQYILDANDILKMKENNQTVSDDPEKEFDYQWPDEIVCFACYGADQGTLPNAFGGNFMGFETDITPSGLNKYLEKLLTEIANGSTLKEALLKIKQSESEQEHGKPSFYKDGEKDKTVCH